MIPSVSFVALQLLGKNPQRYTIYNHRRQLCVCIHMTVYTYMLYGTHLQLFTAIVFLIIFLNGFCVLGRIKICSSEI